MWLEGSSRYSQKFVFGPYSEPFESSSLLHTLFFFIMLSIYRITNILSGNNGNVLCLLERLVSIKIYII